MRSRRVIAAVSAIAAVSLGSATLAAQPGYEVTAEVVFEADLGAYSYVYVIVNLTAGPVADVVVPDIVPRDCEVLGWKATVGDFDPASRVWTIGSLPTAPVARLDLTVAARPGTACPGDTTTTTATTTTPTTTPPTTAATTTTQAPTTSAPATTTPATTTSTMSTTPTTAGATTSLPATTTTIVPATTTTAVPGGGRRWDSCGSEGPLRNIGLLGGFLLLTGSTLVAWPHLQPRLAGLVPVLPVVWRNPFGTTVSPIPRFRSIVPPPRPIAAALPLGGPMTAVETIAETVAPGGGALAAPAKGRDRECGGCCCCCCCGGTDPHSAALAVLGRGNDPRRLDGFSVTTTTTTTYGFAEPKTLPEARKLVEDLEKTEVEADVASGLTAKLMEATDESPSLLALLRGDLEAEDLGELLGGDIGARLQEMLIEVVEARKARTAAAAGGAEEAAPGPAPEPPAVRIEVAPAPPTPPPATPPGPPANPSPGPPRRPAPPPDSGLGI